MENAINAQQKAKKLFCQGYNCCQSVLAAFCEKTGLDFQTSIKIASSFGGGMGRLREVCGAVTGMFMVAGMIFGYQNPKDNKTKGEHYKLIQDLAEQFKKDNHTIICRELLNLDKTKFNPTPEDRTSEYYKKRPCVELVGCAAGIIEEYINKNMEVNNDSCSSK